MPSNIQLFRTIFQRKEKEVSRRGSWDATTIFYIAVPMRVEEPSYAYALEERAMVVEVGTQLDAPQPNPLVKGGTVTSLERKITHQSAACVRLCRIGNRGAGANSRYQNGQGMENHSHRHASDRVCHAQTAKTTAPPAEPRGGNYTVDSVAGAGAAVLPGREGGKTLIDSSAVACGGSGKGVQPGEPQVAVSDKGVLRRQENPDTQAPRADRDARVTSSPNPKLTDEMK